MPGHTPTSRLRPVDLYMSLTGLDRWEILEDSSKDRLGKHDSKDRDVVPQSRCDKKDEFANLFFGVVSLCILLFGRIDAKKNRT